MHEFYKEHLLEHFRHPRHTAPLEAPDVSADEYNPLCGDRIHAELSVRRGRITGITFLVDGCVIATASASLLGEVISGMRLEQARMIDYGKLCEILGITVAPGRVTCATLALMTLQRMLSEFLRKHEKKTRSRGSEPNSQAR